MKHYICKLCGHTWQSANPALECPMLQCRSRLVAETSGVRPPAASSSPVPFARATLFMTFNGVALAAWVAACLLGGMGEHVAAGITGLLALVCFAVAGVILLVLTHRAWRAAQPAAALGRRIPSPGKAVGFLFIPFFNLYWIFVAFPGLMTAANALRVDRRIQAVPFGAGTAVAYAVLTLVNGVLAGMVSLLPMMSMVCAAGVVAAAVLLFWVAHDVVRIINILR